jgi:hypothetical protein
MMRKKVTDTTRVLQSHRELGVKCVFLGSSLGFGLLATRDFQQDEIIFQEDPLVIIWPPNWSCREIWPRDRCLLCLKLISDLSYPCRLCMKAFFCSTAHRDEARELFHETECPNGPIPGFFDLLEVIMDAGSLESFAAARCIAMLVSDALRYQRSKLEVSKPHSDAADGKSQLHNTVLHNSLTAFYARSVRVKLRLELKMDIVDLQLSEALFRFWDECARLLRNALTPVWHLLPPRTRALISRKQWRHWLGRWNLNNQSFGDYAGQGLFSLHSCLNHSCTPNVRVDLFDLSGPARLSLTALRPIKKGQQLTVTYVDPTLPRQARLHILRLGYFFACACERCRGDHPLDPSLDFS